MLKAKNAYCFSLGQVRVTKRCLRFVGFEEIKSSLFNHENCIWDDCSEQDVNDNYLALKSNGNVRSIYKKRGAIEYFIVTDLKSRITSVYHRKDV